MLTLLQQPALLPVTLDEVKSHLAIADHAHDATLLQHVIPAAVNTFEQRTGRQIMTATWNMTLSRFPRGSRPINIPKGQFQIVLDVTYTTETAESVSVSSLRTRGAADYTRVLPAGSGWPQPSETVEQVDVSWMCGWPTVASVPAGVRHAILLLCAHYFEQREPVLVGTISKPLEHSLEALYTIWDLGDEFRTYEPCD